MLAVEAVAELGEGEADEAAALVEVEVELSSELGCGDGLLEDVVACGVRRCGCGEGQGAEGNVCGGDGIVDAIEVEDEVDGVYEAVDGVDVFGSGDDGADLDVIEVEVEVCIEDVGVGCGDEQEESEKREDGTHERSPGRDGREYRRVERRIEL